MSSLPRQIGSARKETSALISLEELLLLEQSRIRDEEAGRRAEEERVIRDRLEAEAKAQEAERAQKRAEEDARREAVRLDEAKRARIEAEGLAAAAAARVQAESAAKLAVMQVVDHQAVELAGATKRRERASFVGRTAVVVLLASASVTLGFFLERAESRAQTLQAALTRSEGERDEKERKLAHMVPKAERDTLQVRLEDADAQLRSLRAGLTPPPKGAASPIGSAMRAQQRPSPAGAADNCAFYRKLRETSPHDPRLFDPANGCL